VFYLYDSYHVAADEWARLLTPGGDISLRPAAAAAAVVTSEPAKTETESEIKSESESESNYDGFFYGLWLQKRHGSDLLTGGFDGAYTCVLLC
jgi:hypothetical protein